MKDEDVELRGHSRPRLLTDLFCKFAALVELFEDITATDDLQDERLCHCFASVCLHSLSIGVGRFEYVHCLESSRCCCSRRVRSSSTTRGISSVAFRTPTSLSS